MSKFGQKFGELLVEKELITKEQLDDALKIQFGEKVLIGKIMTSQSYVRTQDLHKVVAEKHKLEFVELVDVDIDKALINQAQQAEYFTLEVLPINKKDNKITIAATDINDKVINWSKKNYPDLEINYIITSPFDILWTLQDVFSSNDDEKARFFLYKKMPEFSARELFSKKGKQILAGIFLLSLALCAAFPQTSFVSFGVLVNTLCFITVAFKTSIFLIGRNKKPNNSVYIEAAFPIYTVLVPLFKEEKSIKRLITSLENIDYPKSRLDIKFVLEADDEITIKAIKAAQPPQYMEIIRTPYSLPQTKPKACNYALNYARGEYVTIYDAEDEPDPKQLKKALAAFTNGSHLLACVQGRLNYYNAKQNILTRWFSLEYATWFEIVMPGLQRIKAPLPLGGTSNHIKTKILKEIGGWDAFNVTEDADLGMRLSQRGYKCEVIDSITMEEAVSGPWGWLKQRTRWLKGFMQTYFVHMRHPKKLIANTGWQGFLTLQFFMGIPVAIYLTVPIWTVAALYAEMPPFLFAFAVVNLFFSAIAHAAMAIIAANKLTDFNGKKLFPRKPIISAFTIPIYGVLQIFAAYRALYQLIFKPHYWDKTEHGAN